MKTFKRPFLVIVGDFFRKTSQILYSTDIERCWVCGKYVGMAHMREGLSWCSDCFHAYMGWKIKHLLHHGKIYYYFLKFARKLR
jgi:hypothetical protein